MTLILSARKHPRDARPRCQAINARKQQCEFRAVVCINGKWYCRHPKHQPKEEWSVAKHGTGPLMGDY